MPSLSTRSGLAAKAFGFLASNQPVGQQIYELSTAGGTNVTATGQRQFTFTVPTGVTSISVLCVGGGGFANPGFGNNSTAGGGGALAYTNNYSVTPGQTFTVLVGNGDANNSSATNGNLASSRNTTFGSTICGAGGGQTDAFAAPNAGGAVLYGTGGAGGAGTYATGNYSGGGGGAGGYSGAGGTGGGRNAAGTAGSGGGGGGGGGSNAAGFYGGVGGGVGLFGTGSNGAGGVSTGGGDGYCGTGGSGGEYSTSFQVRAATAAKYGAGAGGNSPNSTGKPAGATGAVRIVWPGNIRQFPSTNVGNF